MGHHCWSRVWGIQTPSPFSPQAAWSVFCERMEQKLGAPRCCPRPGWSRMLAKSWSRGTPSDQPGWASAGERVPARGWGLQPGRVRGDGLLGCLSSARERCQKGFALRPHHPSTPVAQEKMQLRIHSSHSTERSPRHPTSAGTAGGNYPC